MGPDGAGVLADAAARASAQMPAEGGPGPGMQVGCWCPFAWQQMACIAFDLPHLVRAI